MAAVQFWFDPICPWTYVTYQWLNNVREVRDVQIAPRLLSLHFLNQGRENTPHAAAHLASLELERFLAAVRDSNGPELTLRAYSSIAVALFLEGRTAGTDMIGKVAASLDLDVADSVAAAEDPSWDEVIRSDHDAAMALVGDDVGSPVIAIAGGTAFFGPVLARAPRGEDAGVIWDACVALASHPDFYELKRSRGDQVKARFS
jgi:2-hydroxychromene-2-carboxylate isomerase